ncbi:PREDICTED: cytoskeleton-associated protein 2-like [Chaetura pelagica]|uniref:cytoskeleton-associated protein 2-like n=1 Tax=Chaetura pelagica TaxID=8897 RepID=UPI0005234427|nr:PREDICTED: cytoskeleton-associated protein 2-like [Chaetura pelagica]
MSQFHSQIGDVGGEQRRRLQEYIAAKEKLKCPSAKPFLKDQTNRLNPTLARVSKLQHVDRNKKDVPGSVANGPWRDGKPAVKPRQHAGQAAQQKPSNTTQRVTVVCPQLRRSTKHPLGPLLSLSQPTQPRGRLPTSTATHPNPERNKKPSEGTVITAAPLPGSDHPPPGALSSLDEGLQDRLACNKENLPAQVSTHPVLNRVFQSDGNNLGNTRALAHRQSSATSSRTVPGPKDRINNHQAKEGPDQDKFRRAAPGSKSASQKPSVRTQPLQPPQLLAASADLLQKNIGANQEKTHLAKELRGKLLSARPGGGLQHCSRRPQMRRSPSKLPACSRPQGPPNSKSSLKAGGTLPWHRPAAQGHRRDAEVAPPGRTATSQVMLPQNQSRIAHSSKIPALKSGFGNKGVRLKAEVPKAGQIQARCVPKISSAADRKKQLEEWLASKGKTYKRPPMMLLQKQAVKLAEVPRSTKKKEKQEEREQPCLEKINNIFTKCLKLVEEGVGAEELSAMLSSVPQAEKFAKFWICKAKLLARSSSFDVTGLYRAAVCAGATPLQELREVVLDILKAADQTSEGDKAGGPTTPCPSERQHVVVTPCPTGRPLPSLPLSIKLQVTSATRRREFLQGQELKFLTPVRRSLRIDQAGSHYPEMLKDHDPVVSSLSEILDAEEETQFFFRKNKALPEVAELEGLRTYPPECC